LPEAYVDSVEISRLNDDLTTEIMEMDSNPENILIFIFSSCHKRLLGSRL